MRQLGARERPRFRLDARRMPERNEPREAPALGFVRVHGEALEAEAARMRDMIGAAGHGAPGPAIVQVERQRRVDRDRGLQARRRLPRAVAYAADVLARRTRARHRYAPAVAGDDITLLVEAAHAHLHALERRIDVAHRAARGAFLAEHVPRLERLAQFDLDGPVMHAAVQRKA